jgi:hypothetical protein
MYRRPLTSPDEFAIGARRELGFAPNVPLSEQDAANVELLALIYKTYPMPEAFTAAYNIIMESKPADMQTHLRSLHFPLRIRQFTKSEQHTIYSICAFLMHTDFSKALAAVCNINTDAPYPPITLGFVVSEVNDDLLPSLHHFQLTRVEYYKLDGKHRAAATYTYLPNRPFPPQAYRPVPLGTNAYFDHNHLLQTMLSNLIDAPIRFP